MVRVVTWGLTLLAGAFACKRDANDYDRPAGVSTGAVTSSGQPESVIDPRTGVLVPAAASLVIGLNAVASDDLRTDAAKTATAPTLDDTRDPRTFAASGTYTPGAGIPTRDPLAGQIAVVSDGKAASHAACAYPFPAPGNAVTTGLVVDGSLSEWTAASVVGVDRAGDIAASDLDLRAVYFAKDASYVYLGAAVTGTWGTTYTSAKELVVEFRQVVDGGNGSALYTNSTLRYYVRGAQLWTSSALVAQGLGIGQTDYTISAAGSEVELRIARATIQATVGATFSVNVYAHDQEAADYDRVGAHITGLTDDYACLVPLPSAAGQLDHFKMLVFRRAGAATADMAEIGYRAVIAAMQAAEYAAQDDFAYGDTLSVVVPSPFSYGYDINANIGLQLGVAVSDALGDVTTPREAFRNAAHGYLMWQAAYDYDTPRIWTLYGYSRWMGYRTIASYYGRAAGQLELYKDFREFLAEEALNPTAAKYVEDEFWGDAPFSSAYYVNKSGAWLELTSRLVSYDDLLDKVLREGRRGWTLHETDDVIHQIKDRKSYVGSATDDLRGGWFDGEYATSVLPATLLDDTDADGLLDFQETARGTDPSVVDTDKDGVSDAQEVALGRGPTTVEPLRSLVVDNYLGDWELLLPTALRTTGITNDAATVCGGHTTIQRYGAVVSEGWLVAPIELAQTPTAAQGVVVYLVVDLPSTTTADPYFAWVWGSQSVSAFNAAATGFRAPAPFVGRTIELTVNAVTLGWTDGKLPAGTTVYVTTTATGATSSCSYTGAFTPATTLP